MPGRFARPRRTTSSVWSTRVAGTSFFTIRKAESEEVMGLDDKVKNAAQEAKGKVKEGWGKATDDPELQAEGQADQAAANVKQAGENVKDAFKKA